MQITTALLILLTAGLTGSLEATTSGISTDAVLKESYGKLNDGRDVALLTLTNRKGMVAKITEYGGNSCQPRNPLQVRQGFRNSNGDRRPDRGGFRAFEISGWLRS
ncbi:MAG: hypothetical protein WCH43_13715, partial [Verrucomicrobiota bacterium]